MRGWRAALACVALLALLTGAAAGPLMAVDLGGETIKVKFLVSQVQVWFLA